VPLIKDNACLNEPYFRPTTITLEDLGAAGKTVFPSAKSAKSVCVAWALLAVARRCSVFVCGRSRIEPTSTVRSVLCLYC
jgi:hypothetical protein